MIDIDTRKLLPLDELEFWSSSQFVNAWRHDQGCPELNPHFRQLIHAGYKVAAEWGERYLGVLEECQ